MGAALASAFIPPGSLLGCEEGEPEFEGGEPVVTCIPPSLDGDWVWGMVQVLSLLAVYGYVLFTASNMLSEGSELLLLVPSLANLVGSIVLPILGAVPDGAIMLFSGLGPGAQENLGVGVGALAGSTIMLLTVPWGLCILAGAVGIKDGTADYVVKKRRGSTISAEDMMAQKMAGEGLGVSPSGQIAVNARIMIATSLIYLVIQGPAIDYMTTPATAEINKEIAQVESGWSLLGLGIAIASFCLYLILMICLSNDDDEVKNEKVNKVINKVSSTGEAKILTLIAPMINQWKTTAKDAKAEALLENVEQVKRFAAVLEPHFTKYDVDGDGTIGVDELPLLLKELGAQDVTRAKVKDAMETFDTDHSGGLDKKEMVQFVLKYVMSKGQLPPNAVAAPSAPEKGMGILMKTVMIFIPMQSQPQQVVPQPVAVVEEADGEQEEEEEEAEMPEDLADLSPEEQQSAIMSRAFGMMAIGTGLILIFSDPMVDVLSNVGERISVPPFYISFALAPLASNASELIASITYAKKKTKKTITVALSALEGAACMNNTFCLAIFMGLVYFQGLAWKFSAETLAILIVEFVVGIIAMQPTMSRATGIFILTLFPLSIALIAYLEAIGYD